LQTWKRQGPPSVVSMEVCGAAHDWAREIRAMGHEARLIPPNTNGKRGNNAAAAAIEPRRWHGEPMRAGQERGKDKLGAITKPGNRAIRRRRVLGGPIAANDCGGAIALVRVAGKWKGARRDWRVARFASEPARRATFALANKPAPIIAAVLTTGARFAPRPSNGPCEGNRR
jgi:hypothetical protein